MKKKFLRVGAYLMLAVFGVLAYFIYTDFYCKSVNHTGQAYSLKIRRVMSFDDVREQLLEDGVISDKASFDRVAALLRYNQSSIKTGHYLIPVRITMSELVKILKTGRQTPIKYTFNNLRTISDFIIHSSANFDFTESEMTEVLFDQEFLDSNNVDSYSLLSLFIPDTYEVYYNTSAQNLVKKLLSYHWKFWNSDNRLEKAQELGMTPAEVYTLASIVEKETNHNEERPRIAGVYLNRLKKGMKLQADPTVVYATGEFSLRRVLNEHLQINSRYNTYIYHGLPPGPIFMPSVSSIDAVLNYEKHNYLYFCAAPGYNAEHLFADTFEQHQRNAMKYRKWLNSEQIR